MSSEDKKKVSWSTPDYEGWAKVVRETKELSSSRFYFVVTVATLGVLAYFLFSNPLLWAAGYFVSSLILVFGFTAFLMHWTREGDDHARKIEEIKSPNQFGGRRTIEETSTNVKVGEFDRGD